MFRRLDQKLAAKSDTKLLLYGRRDKTSVQSNRHCASSVQKCPKYIESMITQDRQNNNKDDCIFGDELLQGYSKIPDQGYFLKSADCFNFD